VLNLITDRTAQDVVRWKLLKAKRYDEMTDAERREWLSGAARKGAYNYTDLNRVESAVAHLGEQLARYGYGVKLHSRRVWEASDVPTVSDMTRYLANVKLIREAFTRFRSTPAVPASLQRLNYAGANDIEQILADVETLINNMVTAFVHAGDIYGGEL
jgi:hypothetical protein